nr:GtrA family protein [Lactobacillus hamsteri]
MAKDNKNKAVVVSDEANIRKLGQKLIKRHRNLWVYTIFGFIAALINTLVFIVLHQWWHSAVVISNTIAFIISNLASFYFNQKAVFINNVDHEHTTWHKLVVFFTYRIISLIPDTLIMLVGVSWLHLNALVVKVIDQVLVGIFNYLTTRSVFQKQEHTMIERAKMRIREQKEKHNEKSSDNK